MQISQEAVAVVAATVLGPIAAVLITLWREAVKSKRDRRLSVFRMLMATRRLTISNDHVGAINLIEVNFYKCAGVEAAWKVYKSHLNLNDKPEDQAWRDDRTSY